MLYLITFGVRQYNLGPCPITVPIHPTKSINHYVPIPGDATTTSEHPTYNVVVRHSRNAVGGRKYPV
jgi:hypothetical protein